MLTTHDLPADAFAALAAGHGDAAAIEELRASQYSRRLLLMRLVLAAADRAAPGGRADADRAVELLGAAQRAAPAAMRAAVLEPHVGAWAAHCLRRLHGLGGSGGGYGLEQLTGVAVAAALRAGVDFDLDAPLPHGRLHLPGLGLATAPDGDGRVRIRFTGGDLTVGPLRVPAEALGRPGDEAGGDEAVPGWTPVRRLSATADGLTLTVTLDDLDPYRAARDLTVAPRVTASAAARWRALLQRAWALLVAHHRRYATGIAAGLRSLVPLAGDGTAHGMSATSRDAFGAISLTFPHDPANFADTLIHEFQHNKLGAVLDLIPLYDESDKRLLYAPWRDDPRPIGGLLQGAYAFLAVTDFWRVHRWVTDQDPGGLAHFKFARWRERVGRVIQVLRDSGSFRPVGLDFLDGMQRTLDGMRDEEVPPAASARARQASDDHWLRWRLANLRPDESYLAALATAYRAGAAPPAAPAQTRTVPRDRALEPEIRLSLAALRATRPDRFAALAGDPAALAAEVPGASPADVALVADDAERAVAAYRAELADHPTCTHRWAGLALAVGRLAPDGAAAGPLTTRPEVVYRLCLELASAGEPADPLAVSAWLATGSRDAQAPPAPRAHVDPVPTAER